MKDYYICQYCGFEQIFFSWTSTEERKCSKCHDHNLRIKKEALKGDVFGYKHDEAYRKRYPLE